MSRDYFPEFFDAFGRIEPQEGDVTAHEARARKLYDHLLTAAKSGRDIREALYEHTCQVCGEWQDEHGSRYCTWAYRDDLRSQGIEMTEAEADAQLREQHAHRDHSMYYRDGTRDWDPAPIIDVIERAAAAS